MTSCADFASTYAQMPDGELARVLRDKHSLVPDAVSALDHEIQKRNLDPSELRKLKPHSIEESRHPTALEKRMKSKRLSLPWQLVTCALSGILLLSLDQFGVEQLFWPVVITILITIVAANVALFSLMGWPWGTHRVSPQMVAGLCTLESIPTFALIARIQKRLDHQRRTSPAGKIETNPS